MAFLRFSPVVESHCYLNDIKAIKYYYDILLIHKRSFSDRLETRLKIDNQTVSTPLCDYLFFLEKMWLFCLNKISIYRWVSILGDWIFIKGEIVMLTILWPRQILIRRNSREFSIWKKVFPLFFISFPFQKMDDTLLVRILLHFY